MSENNAEIRIVKKKKAHGGHHGGAWKVAYADFVTAMMAFFLVMWIVGLSQNVKEAIGGYFQDPQAFMEAVKTGDAPFQVGEVADIGKGAGSETSLEAAERELERKRLEEAGKAIQEIIDDTPEFRNLREHIEVRQIDEGLQIDLIEEEANLFFDSASTRVKPSTRELLIRIAQELGKLPNKVILEGHTDSRPLARTDGYTNWELSADRANSARKVMESSGLQADQVVQVRGYASTKLRDPKHPSHFSNRRVSIVVVLKTAMNKQAAEVHPERKV